MKDVVTLPMLKAVLKQTLPVGSVDAVKRLKRNQREWKAAKLQRGKVGLKLNIGCGPNIKPGWVNIDRLRNADVIFRCGRPIPFQDGCCLLIYSGAFS